MSVLTFQISSNVSFRNRCIITGINGSLTTVVWEKVLAHPLYDSPYDIESVDVLETIKSRFQAFGIFLFNP
jgi:hypothetical protein